MVSPLNWIRSMLSKMEASSFGQSTIREGPGFDLSLGQQTYRFSYCTEYVIDIFKEDRGKLDQLRTLAADETSALTALRKAITELEEVKEPLSTAWNKHYDTKSRIALLRSLTTALDKAQERHRIAEELASEIDARYKKAFNLIDKITGELATTRKEKRAIREKDLLASDGILFGALQRDLIQRYNNFTHDRERANTISAEIHQLHTALSS